MGGNKNTRAYGWYVSPFAGKIWLESSYEHKVAVELDTNLIKWKRPSYLVWKDGEGKTRKYFPDFYLEDYNVYHRPEE